MDGVGLKLQGCGSIMSVYLISSDIQNKAEETLYIMDLLFDAVIHHHLPVKLESCNKLSSQFDGRIFMIRTAEEFMI